MDQQLYIHVDFSQSKTVTEFAEASASADQIFEEYVVLPDHTELISPPPTFEVAVTEQVSEAEVQLSIPSDDDLSLTNVDELMRLVTKDIQDKLNKENQTKEVAAQLAIQ